MVEGFPGLIAIAMIGIAGVVMVRAFGPRKSHQSSRASDSGNGFWSGSSGSTVGSSSSETSHHESGSSADTGSPDSGGGGGD